MRIAVIKEKFDSKEVSHFLLFS